MGLTIPQLDVPDWRWIDRRFYPEDLAHISGGPLTDVDGAANAVRCAASMISAGCGRFQQHEFEFDPLAWEHGELALAPFDPAEFQQWRNNDDARKAQEIMALTRRHRCEWLDWKRLVNHTPVLCRAVWGD